MPPPADGFAARLVLGPALRTQPDRRLVALVRDGYETAFDEIVRRYGGPLRRYAATIVGSRSEDITQDAFSKALLALRKDGAEIELRPWLFRIVRNTALNDLRDAPPSSEVLAEALAGGRNPAEELERREELAELIERLQSLPEPQRAAIVMRELEGLGHEEIAAALGLSGGGARQAIYRARQTLRDGFGLLLPVPLLKALLSGSSPASVEAAVAAGGAGGAGVALKAATATVLVAGAVGAGVAIDHGHHHEGPNPVGLDVGGPSRAAAAARQLDTTSGGNSAETELGISPGSPDDRRNAEKQRDSIQEDGDHGGHEGPSTSPTGQGDGDRGGKDAVEPTNSGDESGASSGPGESPSSDDSSVGSSGPGGGSGSDGDGGGGGSSGPGDGTTAPTNDESPDTESSNSGPGSDDDSAGRSSGSDDQRDPHGAIVFSVQEMQP